MSYPIPNYTRVWVRGRIIDLARAATGESTYGAVTPVTFAPSPRVLVNAGTKQIISTGPFRVTPDSTTGYFQILLPATDDPDVNPSNFTYRVSEGATGRIYDIVVPQDTAVLNASGDPLNGERVIELSDIVPAPGPSGGFVQLSAGRGVDSIDIVDSDFVATYSDGETSTIGPVPAGGEVSQADLDALPFRADNVTTTGAATGSLSALRKGASTYTLEPAAPATGATRARIGMAVVGDSITAFQSSYAQAWHRQMAILSGQTILWRGAFGTSGFTLEQIEATHLPTVLALAVPPQICVIAGGTNNTGAASGYSEASSRATLLRIAAALEAKGIKPALWTLPPRDDDATVRDRVYRWNAWIYRTALANGWPVVDAFGALADPATGLYKTALKLDSVHPNKSGHLAIAQRVLTGNAFTKHVQDFRPDFAESTVDTANLVVNGLFVGDTDSNGRADSWSAFGSPTHSLLPATFGNWQRVSVASGAAPSGAFRQDIPITPGRTYAMSALVHADLDPTNSAVTFTLEPQWRDATTSIAGDAAFLEMHSVLDTYGAGYREVVAPAGATTLRLTGIVAGTPTRNIYADTAQVTVRDITALTATTS